MSRLAVNWKSDTWHKINFQRKSETFDVSKGMREDGDKIEIYVAIWNNHLSHLTWPGQGFLWAGRRVESNQFGSLIDSNITVVFTLYGVTNKPGK